MAAALAQEAPALTISAAIGIPPLAAAESSLVQSDIGSTTNL
ncbi:hypothetical protein [Streptomyces formicae]